MVGIEGAQTADVVKVRTGHGLYGQLRDIRICFREKRRQIAESEVRRSCRSIHTSNRTGNLRRLEADAARAAGKVPGPQGMAATAKRERAGT